MSALVKDAVKIHRVELPASRYGRHILVETCNERNMPRPGLGRYTRVGNAKSAVFKDAGAQEGREGPRGKVLIGFRVWFWK